MSPKKRRADIFADETTRPYEPASGVPDFVEDEATLPVDVEEMAEAARASTLMPDLDDRSPTRVPPPEPYATVRVIGTTEEVTLAAHNVSPTGVALAIANGVAPALVTGAAVAVQLHLGGDSAGQRAPLRLTAQVAHRRQGRGGQTGGLSLRWDPIDAETVARVLFQARPR